MRLSIFEGVRFLIFHPRRNTMVQPSEKRKSILRSPYDALVALSMAGRTVLLLFAIGWCVWFSPFDDLLDRSGTPLGADYVMLYVSGETLLADEAEELYDDRANQVRSSALFPTMKPNQSWPFRYPPVTAWLMTGLSRLPFAISFAVFSTLCITCICLATTMLLRSMAIADANIAKLAFWSFAGWPIVGETLLGGQSSPIALCLVISAIVALRSNRDVLAGALLGLCIYKPNIVGIFILGTLVARPKTFWGMLAVAIPAGAISLYATGWEGIRTYVELATSLTTSAWNLETPFHKVHGLGPYFDLAVPGKGKMLAFLCGIPLAIWIGRYWRSASGRKWWLAFGSLLTANALFNPYVPIYDMVLIGPACVATVFYLMEKYEQNIERVFPFIVALVALWFLGPHLSQSVSKTLGIQLFPLGLTAALAVQIRELLLSSTAGASTEFESTGMQPAAS